MATRRRSDAGPASSAKPKRARPSHALAPDRGTKYRCHSCGAIFARYAWAEKHLADIAGRIEIVLPGDPCYSD